MKFGGNMQFHEVRSAGNRLSFKAKRFSMSLALEAGTGISPFFAFTILVIWQAVGNNLPNTTHEQVVLLGIPLDLGGMECA